MCSADVVYYNFVKPGPRRIEADEIAGRSLPLACFFCCPASFHDNLAEGLHAYLGTHFRDFMRPEGLDLDSPSRPRMRASLEDLPDYVLELLGLSDAKVPSPPPHGVDAAVIFNARASDRFRDLDLPPADERRLQAPCARLTRRVSDLDARIREIAEQDRKLGIRAAAGADGVSDETLREILVLGDDWRERRDVYLSLPQTVGDPWRTLLLVDRLRRLTHNGNDLFFLEETVRDVGRSSPGHKKTAEDLLSRFYDHIGPPPEELFRWVDTPKNGRVELWREIPPGEFLMGSLPSEEGSDAHERPRHKVVVKSAFRLAAVPVTVAQFAAFDPRHVPYHSGKVPHGDLPHHPVENVTWFQAVSFCRWLSSAYPWARGARLPTEEEWEYACRAGAQTRYWSGDQEADLGRVGWYRANSGNRTHRVGEKPANPWGLYDMHGNVWEWTLGEWSNDYSGRERGAKIDPSAVDPADHAGARGAGRVIRGGGYWGEARDVRSAYRVWFEGPRDWDEGLGFRVCLPAVPEP